MISVAVPDARETEALFRCRRCGECCRGKGGIVLRERDAERLAVFLDLPAEAFYGLFTEENRGKRRLAVTQEGVCVFSGVEGCAVHPAKPDICRAWPFFRGNLIDPFSFAMAKQGCPGIAKDADFVLFSRAGAGYLLARSIFVLPGEMRGPAALLREAELRQLATEDAPVVARHAHGTAGSTA